MATSFCTPAFRSMPAFRSIVSLICSAALFIPMAAAQLPEPLTSYTVETGTKVPLGLINSVSTKHSSPGDRIYLESVFPIVISGHVVIPAGSYVTGTVTGVNRPGRVKGKGEIYVRFDSITLPNGVTREFRSRLGSIDSTSSEKLVEKKEGVVQADSNKGGDARTVGVAAASGASIGAIAGSAAGHAVQGLGIGAAAGAAAGLIGVLATRGPDAVLAKGSTIEMILDRPLTFEAGEVNFTTTGQAGRMPENGGNQAAEKSTASRRFPF